MHQVCGRLRTTRKLFQVIARGKYAWLSDQQDNSAILLSAIKGRVQRLKPPHWRAAPPPARFGKLAQNDGARAREAVGANARLIAAELGDLGINVDCLPVLDLRMIGRIVTSWIVTLPIAGIVAALAFFALRAIFG